MAKHILVVLSNPVEGKEDEYNDWYTNQHLGDVCAAPGFVAARRFKVVDGESDHKYLAIYEMESDDPKADFAGLAELGAAGKMPLSDAIDVENVKTLIFEQIASS